VAQNLVYLVAQIDIEDYQESNGRNTSEEQINKVNWVAIAMLSKLTD